MARGEAQHFCIGGRVVAAALGGAQRTTARNQAVKGACVALWMQRVRVGVVVAGGFIGIHLALGEDNLRVFVVEMEVFRVHQNQLLDAKGSGFVKLPGYVQGRQLLPRVLIAHEHLQVLVQLLDSAGHIALRLQDAVAPLKEHLVDGIRLQQACDLCVRLAVAAASLQDEHAQAIHTPAARKLPPELLEQFLGTHSVPRLQLGTQQLLQNNPHFLPHLPAAVTQRPLAKFGDQVSICEARLSDSPQEGKAVGKRRPLCQPLPQQRDLPLVVGGRHRGVEGGGSVP
mmetsp:Transcript_39379/g.99230  ORF Transcript_39379/g.99230 Transcript_39379/m.99230 type:complete len:285 (-) Transcript_39379:197-1051(-)